MRRSKPGRAKVREWRQRERVSLNVLSERIGDPGRQLQRWESGERPSLPLRLKVALARETQISLEELSDPDERLLLREVARLISADERASL